MHSLHTELGDGAVPKASLKTAQAAQDLRPQIIYIKHIEVWGVPGCLFVGKPIRGKADTTQALHCSSHRAGEVGDIKWTLPVLNVSGPPFFSASSRSSVSTFRLLR